jgi:SAM-dependent methyltransferase
MSDRVYDETRAAWHEIWLGTDVDRELQTRDYARARLVRDRFVPHLPAGELLLEAGCGLGAELLGLEDAGHRVVGIDYVPAAVQRLKRYRRTVTVAAGDVHALPFHDGTFGAYLSFGVLEHFPFGPEPALREAHRVLRTGGILVLTVPAPSLVWRLVRARAWRRGQAGKTHGYYETTYSAADLARRVRAQGFGMLELRPIGHDFTLWGCGRAFRGPGYYQTSRLAERLGALFAWILPRSMSFATLVIARKGAPR